MIAVALTVFLAGLLVLKQRGEENPDATGPTRRSLLAAAFLGLLWALASYLPFVLSPKTQGPVRTQFLSAPGVAVLLAAVVVWVASFLPRRARFPAAGLLGAWVVAVGTGRSAALQAEWDLKSAYPNQRRTLLELATVAPDLAPGTLVVLLTRGPTWQFDFSFRHAVRYLYEGRAVGHVVGADDLLYRTLFEADGVRSEPIATLRRPWREPALLYGYNAIVVLREGRKGRLEFLGAWPDGELPALPAGAVYAPRLRLRGGGPPRRLAILGPPL